MSLRRSHTTPVSKAFGEATIEVVDENGRPTPARMGIYDRYGRLPLPGEQAIFVDTGMIAAARVIRLGQSLPPWPIKNRSAFYTDGRYRSRLPAGNYELIVAKGPEHRVARRSFTVRADETQPIRIELQRWTDMAAKGWYSGETHVHYRRDNEHDDQTLQLLTRAEDLKVANILQIDNSAKVALPHYAWQPVVPDPTAPFVLVPGQEAPRTSRLGHTIQLNIKQPIRDPARYLLYHTVFENTRAQGGLAGYAHVSSNLDVLHKRDAGHGRRCSVWFGGFRRDHVAG